MANSVGQIELDLELKQENFNKQIKGVQKLAKKAGAAIAGAFALKKIIDFGAACIELGSDLQEVQNVVDVVFPSMSKQVDRFAKNAAVSFGLSETMAKKFTGTFGAMAKAFGFNEQAAYEMSTALTGLAGDVASFYNMSQDEAFTKLKSVFTGETETLKDLGVVMTQAALDQYALANGYGKTTAKMTEAEKVALRYKFVTEQLSQASGDFIRTSDGWANQVRVLKLQFDSLKAAIGQGLIAALTPVIKVLNLIIGKLLTLASTFKAVTEMFGGKKSGAAAGMGAVAGAAAEAGKETAGVGEAAKKAAKDIKGITTGIDELNVVNQGSDSGSGSGAAGTDFQMGEVDTSGLEETEAKYAALVERVKELQGIFAEGFQMGFQNQDAVEDILRSVQRIKSSLKGLFSDTEVTGAANGLLDSFALNIGKITGSFTSVGVTIGANLLGGTANYLEQNVGYIKERLIKTFDAQADILNSWGDFSVTFAELFSTFAGEDGKQITANIIGIFGNAFLGIQEIVMRDLQNLSKLMTEPFIKNKDAIKTALENTLAPVAEITTSIQEVVTDSFAKVSEVYDTYVEPAFERFSSGLSTIFEGALQSYNEYMAPVFEWISGRFSEIKDIYLQPFIDAFLDLWGRAVEAISMFWEFCSPFIAWFVEQFIANLVNTLMQLWTKFEWVFSVITTILTAFMEILSGVIDFVVGIFTGDWQRAWDGIQKIFDAIWELIKKLVQAAINYVYNTIKTILTRISNTISVILNGIKALWDAIWTTIANLVKTIIEGIQTRIDEKMGKIKSGIQTALEGIKKIWGEIWNHLKDTVKNIFNEIWSFLKGIINDIIKGVETMANGLVRAINRMIDALNGLSFEIPDWVPEFGGKSIGLNIGHIPTVSIPRLAQGGFVKANTPQLAMIGDNKRHGEIVAPEDKMQAMVDRAVAMAAGSGDLSAQYLEIMIELLRRIIELIEALDLTVTIDIREVKKKLSELEKRNGHVFRTT